MLTIAIPPVNDLWDERNQEFLSLPDGFSLCLEHSLVSMSKWESKWCIPYASRTHVKTNEQVIDYIRCMTITKNVPDVVYRCLTRDNLKEINAYIDAPMTATTFAKEPPGQINGEQITAELIYWEMFELNIPMECQKWHLNRLLTLIKVCAKKRSPPKKMSQQEIMRRNTELNAQRRAKFKSKG